MDAGLATALASVIVAIVAAVAAWASARAAGKAQTHNTDVTVEAKRLEQAYERARKFDIETIQRQDVEISELRETEEELQAQVVALRARVATLEIDLAATKRELANYKKDKRRGNPSG
jgi:hypothetical protein